ncbi:helix-turn-helix domain-containing protein [Metabacillus sp. JX24]|uniref:helix-turn-helix domain-containing protein n=1 Tax=Metabacillus sp. JX24 TaxID=3240759 RepID=UPI00350EB712
MEFKALPNYRKAEIYKENYKEWKKISLKNLGYFPVFQPFKEEFLLKKLSGNAIRLYLYLGLHAGNHSGETWVSIETISKYFDKSPRAISYWIKELENYKLIIRVQLRPNESSHTFLRPYGLNKLNEIENPDFIFNLLNTDENF